MAMLAEPRRKKRVINMRHKNAWTEDEQKFGQKMLEKMGWQKGNGLGAKQDGNTEHVKVKFKDDNAGLGFKDKNDQWTKHDDDFNGLLQSLNGGSVDDSKLHSEKSLVEKSKNLRSRLHYKKFTQGKDLSKYSIKDLANIFGKKTLEKSKANKEETAVAAEMVEEKVDENAIGSGYSFTVGGSIRDYFRSKMGKKTTAPRVDEADEDHCSFAFRGFAGTESPTDAAEENHVDNVDDTPGDASQFATVKLKRKKSKEIEPQSIDGETHEVNLKEKKRKRKRDIDIPNEFDENVCNSNDKVKKKKSKNKAISTQEHCEDDIVIEKQKIVEIVSDENVYRKKSKKNKIKS